MNKGDDVLFRMMEMSKSVQQENEAKRNSGFVEEKINQLRNTLFRDLGKCNGLLEKIELIHYFISESKRREDNAQKVGHFLWVIVYSKFQEETLNPLKDFTITNQHEAKKPELSVIKPSAPPVVLDTPKPNDDRIACNATSEQILEYFMILSTTSWNGKPIMTTQDIAEFCAANFVGFQKPEHFRKFPLNIKNQRVFIYFLRLFYSEFGTRGSKKKYADLLVKNFNEFANTNPENIFTNFSRHPRKTDIIPTLEFFRKNKRP